MGQTTITIQDETLERFKQLKAELDDEQNAPDHSADSFLNGLLDTWQAVENGHYEDAIDSEAIAGKLDAIEKRLENQTLTLDASERSAIAREIAEELR